MPDPGFTSSTPATRVNSAISASHHDATLVPLYPFESGRLIFLSKFSIVDEPAPGFAAAPKWDVIFSAMLLKAWD